LVVSFAPSRKQTTNWPWADQWLSSSWRRTTARQHSRGHIQSPLDTLNRGWRERLLPSISIQPIHIRRRVCSEMRGRGDEVGRLRHVALTRGRRRNHRRCSLLQKRAWIERRGPLSAPQLCVGGLEAIACVVVNLNVCGGEVCILYSGGHLVYLPRHSVLPVLPSGAFVAATLGQKRRIRRVLRPINAVVKHDVEVRQRDLWRRSVVVCRARGHDTRKHWSEYHDALLPRHTSTQLYASTKRDKFVYQLTAVSID
jgi:hypothetical protein